MKSLVLFVFCLASLIAQPAPQQAKPPAPDGAAVAFDDGTTLTMEQVQGLLAAVNNPEASKNIQAFLDQWALFRKLAHLAEEAQLEKESPFKDQLAYSRVNVLAQAEIQVQSNPIVQNDDLKKFYDDHKGNFSEIKTNAIYIAFSGSAASRVGTDGKRVLSQDEAKAKATALLEQIRKGADFKKLARENSDDEPSRAKDGYFGDLKPSDPMPDNLRAAIFKLKAGETTDVIGQPNGFYLFQAEAVTYKPYSDVKDQVDRAYKEDRFKQWFLAIQSSTKAKILDPKLLAK
jgi:peptidyl-prolyl cis-trans isomerase C